MTITGTSESETIVGTEGPDDIDASQGGDDIVRAGGGDDTIYFGDNLSSLDKVFGGGGNDALSIAGGLDEGHTFDSSNFRSIEQFFLSGAFDYTLTLLDSAVGDGASFELNASSVAAGQHVVFDASTEAGASIHYAGGAAQDIVGTGAGNDTIETGDGSDLVGPGSGRDTVNAGGGDDGFIFGTGGLDATDRLDGGDTTSNNRIELLGNYNHKLTLGAHTITNITGFLVGGDHNYNLDLGRSTLSTTLSFTVDASSLDAAHHITFDGSHVRAYADYLFTGGDGDDVFVGAFGNDFMTGGLGADTLTGGSNARDGYAYHAGAESTGPTYDTIAGFDTHFDTVYASFWNPITSDLDPKIHRGTLNAANFDDDLAHDIRATDLDASHAALFQARQGDLADELFLVIDANNAAGYQAGADLVIHLEAPKHLADLGLGNFDHI